jgi:hypothetical protein
LQPLELLTAPGFITRIFEEITTDGLLRTHGTLSANELDELVNEHRKELGLRPFEPQPYNGRGTGAAEVLPHRKNQLHGMVGGENQKD